MKKYSPVQSITLKDIRWNVFQLIVVALLLMYFLAFAAGVQAKVFEESEVKSVFLFNLTKFIIWPEEIEDGMKAEFTIAILGSDPFGNHLDKVIESETVRGRKIAIRHYNNPQEVQWQNIDLLFIGTEILDNLPGLRVSARNSGVLTVSDVAGFCQAGGMVNLLTVDNRIKIEVNVQETKRSNFLVSAQVLKLAAIVTTEAEENQ